MFSTQSIPRLHNEDQMGKPVRQQSVRGWSQCLVALSCIVSSCYIEMASEQIEDFMCAVATVIYRACKSVRLLQPFVVMSLSVQ
jgi:hypothetical protein